MDSTNTSDNVKGRLVSKPGIPTEATLGPGVHTVGAGGLLLAPRTGESVTMPLIVILHGAGGEANQALRYLHPYTDDLAVCCLRSSRMAGHGMRFVAGLGLTWPRWMLRWLRFLTAFK
jgi:hypothetical protein